MLKIKAFLGAIAVLMLLTANPSFAFAETETDLTAEENYGYRYKIILPQETDDWRVLYTRDAWFISYRIDSVFLYDKAEGEYKRLSFGRTGPIFTTLGQVEDPLGVLSEFGRIEVRFQMPTFEDPIRVFDYEKDRVLIIYQDDPAGYSYYSRELKEKE